MAIKIWRLEEHSVKQGINLEKFIDQIQQEDGDVTSVKALQTTTKGSSKRNTSSPQFMDNRETVSNSTTTATIVAVSFVPYPHQLKINYDALKDLTDEQKADFERAFTAANILKPHS